MEEKERLTDEEEIETEETEEEIEKELIDVEDIDIKEFDRFDTSTKLADPIKVYLKEIASVPLLTQEEETKLAYILLDNRDAKKQLEIVDADENNCMAIEEYEALCDKAELYDTTKDKLIEANLRLVVSIAKKYLISNVSFEDLIQEGNMGLIRAVEKFDPSKGFKLSTYATWWIRQSITRAIADQGRTIRIPVHMVENINLVKKVERELMLEIGRDPTEQEIADKIGYPLEKVKKIRSYMFNTISLEKRVGEEEDSTLGDFIADTSSRTPYEVARDNALKTTVQALLNTLTEREKKVIEMRFGLDGLPPRTLEECGKQFKITRERIRQIEAKALRKLKHSKRRNMVKAFYEEMYQ